MQIRERFCPVCSSQDSSFLAVMDVRTLLQSNPGYDKAWFEANQDILEHESTLVRCNQCGMVYVKEILEDQWLFRYYNEAISASLSRAKIYNKQKSIKLIKAWCKLRELIDGTPPLKILDFGAGWGDFVATARCVGVETYGLEYDDRKIAFAKSLGLNMGQIDYIKQHAPYDAFFCDQVLEHLDEPKQALLDLGAMLKPNAVGYVSVPDFPITRINDEVAKLKCGRLPHSTVDMLGHLNYFDNKSLSSVLLSAGFVTCSAPQPAHSLNLVNRWLAIVKSGYSKTKGTNLFVVYQGEHSDQTIGA